MPEGPKKETFRRGKEGFSFCFVAFRSQAQNVGGDIVQTIHPDL